MESRTAKFFFILLTLHEVLGQYRHFVFERPEDFRDNGFTCVQHGVAANCVIKQAERAEDLPAYFPSPYLQLPGPLMYVETTVNIDRAHFRLESNARMPGYIVSFRGEYFAHKETSIGCLNSTEDDWHAWPPATPSEDPPSPHWLEGKWLYVTKSRLQKLGFFVYNDRQNSNNLAVFRRLEIVIDEEPNLIVRVDSLEHAAEFGLECVSDDSYQINSSCELKSVKNASELPPYFSDAFTNLAAPSGNNIMYVEGGKGGRVWHKLLLTLPVQFAPNPVGVLSFSAVHYTETTGGLSYGRIFDSNSDCGRWIGLSSSNHSTWVTDKGDAEIISSMAVLPNSKVGFLAINDMVSKAAVFLRLEIRAWFTPDSVIEDPENPDISTSEASTSTSVEVTEPSTYLTAYTDAITDLDATDPIISTRPVAVSSSSESTTANQASSTVTVTVSDVSTTEERDSTTDDLEMESSSTTEFELKPTTSRITTTAPTPGITETELTPTSTAETTSHEPETTTASGRGSNSLFIAPPFTFAAIIITIFMSFLLRFNLV